jgi:putative nucleotidyltransferase with HDIG domain
MRLSYIPPTIAAWFDDYSKTFMGDDPRASAALRPRFAHCIRVADCAEELARALGMDQDEARIAGIAGLLHDVGRGEEYTHTGECAVGATSHAEFGYEAVSRSGILNVLSKRSREIVLAGIRFHNTSRLPATISQDVRRHVLLLRDADKLDKYHMVCDLAPLPTDRTGTPVALTMAVHGPVNPKVLDRIGRLKKVKGIHIGSTLDFYMMVLSLVFVLTYEETFRRVAERRYIERIAAVLPDNPDCADAVHTILAFLRDKTDD